LLANESLPRTFGRFRLLRRLATGSTADVYHARLESERPLVVKCVHRALAADPAFVEALIDEARAVVSLAHPNICRLYEVGVEQGVPYLAQEYVRGRSLHELQRMTRERNRSLPIEAAVHVVCKVLLGLEFARNSSRAAHRGISPRGILIGDEGVVKLNGLGMGAARQQRSGIPAARLPYLSPEEVTGGPVDHRADIFSSAVVLYELLHGAPERLWPGCALLIKLRKTGFGLEPLGQTRQDLPAGLENVIDQALRRDSADRHATPGAFATALQRVLRQARRTFDAYDLARLVATLFSGETQNCPEPEGYDPTAVLDVEEMAGGPAPLAPMEALSPEGQGEANVDDDSTVRETAPPFWGELGEITLVEGDTWLDEEDSWQDEEETVRRVEEDSWQDETEPVEPSHRTPEDPEDT
jgi:serine/threonine protein kinase